MKLNDLKVLDVVYTGDDQSEDLYWIIGIKSISDVEIELNLSNCKAEGIIILCQDIDGRFFAKKSDGGNLNWITFYRKIN